MKILYFILLTLTFAAHAQHDLDLDINLNLDLDASTCKWSEDGTRTILASKGCITDPLKAKNNSVCIGEVICKRKSDPKIEFKWMVTCSSWKCGKADAVKCANDPGFSSMKPVEVSTEVQKDEKAGSATPQ